SPTRPYAGTRRASASGSAAVGLAHVLDGLAVTPGQAGLQLSLDGGLLASRLLPDPLHPRFDLVELRENDGDFGLGRPEKDRVQFTDQLVVDRGLQSGQLSLRLSSAQNRVASRCDLEDEVAENAAQELLDVVQQLHVLLGGPVRLGDVALGVDEG